MKCITKFQELVFTHFKKIELKSVGMMRSTKCCRKNNILFMTSVAYESAIGPLLDVGVDLLKVASPQFLPTHDWLKKSYPLRNRPSCQQVIAGDEVIHLKSFWII